MGQSVVALMYGVRESELPNDLRDKESGEFIWDGELAWGDQPRSAYEGDCLGFKVASSVPDNDEGDLGKTARAGDLEALHAKFVAKAKKRWKEFAVWLLKEHGRNLPPADLWITTDERA